MRLKYYLRGAGVGIIITTIIMSIAFHFYKPSLSADEIKEMASKLGMVMALEQGVDTASGNADESNDVNKKESESSDSNVDSNKDDASSKESNEESDKENTKEDVSNQEDNQDTEDEYVEVVIKGGEYSDVVSNKIYEAGLVKNAEKFNKWLIKHGYDSMVQPGKYKIKKGSTKTESATIITTKED